VVLPEAGFQPLEDARNAAKLRQVVLLSQAGRSQEAISAISVTPFTYYCWRKESGGLGAGVPLSRTHFRTGSGITIAFLGSGREPIPVSAD
jgi:hypothetical protein